MRTTEQRLSFVAGGKPFGVRVAGVALHEAHVLLLRADDATFWVLPGGGVRHGETSAEAIARELREELGVEPRIERLLWVVENLFLFRGDRCHELGFYYLFDMPPGSPWLDTTRQHIHREGEADMVYRWFPVADLDRVALYPVFLRDALRRAPAPFELIVNREDEHSSRSP